jgi:hypothetical protein
MPFERLVEVFRITERRDGAVYKTERVGFEWVPLDEASTPPEDLIYTPLSTKEAEKLAEQGGSTIRRTR